MNDIFSLGEGAKTFNKKSIPKGDTLLFTKDKWVPQSEMNTEEKILLHPIMHEATERMAEEHKPLQPTAFISLCTASRPFYTSTKWKKFISEFDSKVDLIVASSGGVIPKKYWNSYPFLNYDGLDRNDTELYQYIFFYRLILFFSQNKYKYIIANFRPNLANYEPAHKALKLLKGLGHIEDYSVIPDEKTYDKAKELGFRPPHGCGDMFPDLTETILNELRDKIEHYGYNKLDSTKNTLDEWN